MTITEIVWAKIIVEDKALPNIVTPPGSYPVS